jgi:hypothetical protein
MHVFYLLNITNWDQTQVFPSYVLVVQMRYEQYLLSKKQPE